MHTQEFRDLPDDGFTIIFVCINVEIFKKKNKVMKRKHNSKQFLSKKMKINFLILNFVSKINCF